MILFDRVSFRYKEDQETSFNIEEVSFSLAQNKIYGFVGGNGSGKSTFAQLIAGLLKPCSGKVQVCGVDTSDDDAQIHRKVGIIFQNPDNQIVGTTVEEDIAFGLENLAVPGNEIPDRILAVAAELGLEKFLSKPVHHLSGGQKQLLCIAAVLVMEPDWLIFDEPTSHLDPWARREFYHTVANLVKKRQPGIIIISQIPDDFAVFEEVKVFSQGQIVFSGSTEELKRNKDLCDLYPIPQQWLLEDYLEKMVQKDD